MIALVTKLAQDSPCICATVHSLLELQIPFLGWSEQQLPDRLPVCLDAYEAVIIDGTTFQELSPEDLGRLLDYEMNHYVHIIPQAYLQLSGMECDFRTEVDINMLAASAGLMPGHIAPVPTEVILRGYREIMGRYLESCASCPYLNEYHLHVMASLFEVESFGQLSGEWGGRINTVLERMASLVHHPLNIDELAGWYCASFASSRCGDHRFLERVLASADWVIREWSRGESGLLSMGGVATDPLGLGDRQSPFFATTRATLTYRHLHLNEQLHYLGASFPQLTRFSGDGRFLDEVVRLMRYIDAVHRDGQDGQLRHASLHGKPLGEKWGRGETHALMGVFYMLKENPWLPQHVRAEAIGFLDRTGRGLRAYQTEHGLWRNVLDRTDTPEETSCSVLITWIYAYGILHGWWPYSRYGEMVLRGGEGLKRKFWRGYGSGNCRGSFPSPSLEYYLRRPLHMYMMPLIAPALLACDTIRESMGDLYGC